MSDFRSSRLRYRSTRDRQRTQISVSGELDIAAAAEFQAELDRAQIGGATVVLDLADLAFVDSSGLHVLLAADERARQSGTQLVIARPSQPVRRLLEIAGMLDRFEIVDGAGPAPL